MTSGTAQSERTRMNLLVFASACDPMGGSEAAAGWSLIHEFAEYADVTVLVHRRHIEATRRWQQAHPDGRLRFVAVSEPNWMMRWQRRATRLGVGPIVWRARYLHWVRAARDFAQDLEQREDFDAAIHVTIGVYWMPSPVTGLRTPAVWGPMDGAASSPRDLWKVLGVRGVLAELAEIGGVRAASLLPSVQRTWREPAVRLVETEGARQRLPKALRAETKIVNRAFLMKVPPPAPRPADSNYVVFTSPLEKRKAPRLAIEALAATAPPLRLVFVNTGPEEGHLRKLAAHLGVADRVEFRGKVDRDEMWDVLAGAAAGVYTGLREVGGAALAEAMLSGVPVIVLAHNGSRILADAATDHERIAIIEPGPLDQTTGQISEAMVSFSRHMPSGTGSYLDQASTREALRQAILTAAGALRTGTQADAFIQSDGRDS